MTLSDRAGIGFENAAFCRIMCELADL